MILDEISQAIDKLDDHIVKYKQQEAQLDDDIKQRSQEVISLEKRVKAIDFKPVMDSEVIQLELELQHIFRIYVEKLRNHDYLESKLEDIIKKQKENEPGDIFVGLRDLRERNERDMLNDNELKYEEGDLGENIVNNNKQKNINRADINTRGGDRGKPLYGDDDEEEFEENEEEEDEQEGY